jgi:hypothetical protein
MHKFKASYTMNFRKAEFIENFLTFVSWGFNWDEKIIWRLDKTFLIWLEDC